MPSAGPPFRYIAVATCLAALTFPVSAQARGLTTGVADSLFISTDGPTRKHWLDEAAEARAGIVRIDVHWRDVAPTRPTNPMDPADPAYDFSTIDAGVRDAARRGLRVMLTAFSAPDWAEDIRPAGIDAEPGAWKPRAADFGAFARALAGRYSGGFPDPAGPGALPRVRYFEAWNEPNLNHFLAPQWEGKTATGVELYRGLLNSFYDGIKAIHPDDRVIGPGTSPYGFARRGPVMRPLLFLRKLFCLMGRKKLKPGSCPVSMVPRLDVLSHHPIGAIRSPRTPSLHPDDVAGGELGKLREVLRAAERAGTVRPAGRRPLWITEFWWISNPPDPHGVRPVTQARWIEKALYLYWSQGVRVAISWLIRDESPGSSDPALQSGLFFENGSAKPALRAFRFPFLTQRRGAGRVLAWGKTPRAGRLRIQRRAKGDWTTIKQLSVQRGQVFSRRLPVTGRASLRAMVGPERSLVWAQR